MTDKKIWDELAKPFKDDEIEWRVQRCGVKNGRAWASLVPYIDSRAIMNRLDTVVGPEGWSDEYRPIDLMEIKGAMCRLTINGVSKEDAADIRSKKDFGDAMQVKAVISDALKRAAVKFGIGRYLYGLDEFFTTDIKDGRPPKGKRAIRIFSKKDKQEIDGWCEPPSLNGKQEPPKEEPANLATAAQRKNINKDYTAREIPKKDWGYWTEIMEAIKEKTLTQNEAKIAINLLGQYKLKEQDDGNGTE